MGDGINGQVLVGSSRGLFVSKSNGELSFAKTHPPTDKLPQGDSVRDIAHADPATYIATYGYAAERVRGLQRTLAWPEPSANDHLREVTCLTIATNRRL